MQCDTDGVFCLQRPGQSDLGSFLKASPAKGIESMASVDICVVALAGPLPRPQDPASRRTLSPRGWLHCTSSLLKDIDTIVLDD